MAFARVNGTTLHWQDRGLRHAPPVICLNSLGTDLRLWDDVAGRLADRWRVILSDKRGHGLSTGTTPFSIDDLAVDVLALADHLGLKRFAVIGLSIGGLIAQALALMAPDRVAALVLTNTAARIGTAESWAARIAAVEAGGLKGIAEGVLVRWFTAAYRDSQPDTLAAWRRMLLAMPAEGYAAACAALAEADLTPRIGAIAVPTLVAVGDADEATPPDLVRATATAIPGARFALIPECGHIPPAEQPARLADLISGHLTECGHV